LPLRIQWLMDRACSDGCWIFPWRVQNRKSQSKFIETKRCSGRGAASTDRCWTLPLAIAANRKNPAEGEVLHGSLAVENLDKISSYWPIGTVCVCLLGTSDKSTLVT